MAQAQLDRLVGGRIERLGRSERRLGRYSGGLEVAKGAKRTRTVGTEASMRMAVSSQLAPRAPAVRRPT